MLLLVYLSHHSSNIEEENILERIVGKFVCVFKSFIKNDDKIIGSIKMSI